MFTLVIASQKGGVGKTTLAGHLAVAADENGAGPVALLDTDPQGSACAWWNARQALSPAYAAVNMPTLTAQLAALKKSGVKLVIIDTPPAVTATIKKVLAVADLVLVPARASPHDLRAVGGTVDLIRASGRPFVFVINGAANRARITTDAALALSQYGPVAPVVVYQRTDLAASMIDGRTAQEIDPAGRSATEIKLLWKYVIAQLRK